MADDIIKQYMAARLPRIESALTRAVDNLPEPVRPIAAHIFQAGGKRLRPVLTLLMGALFSTDDSRLCDLAISVEMLHAATLLHDDILDNSNSRRGRPCAHLHFGLTQTILAGDALLASANGIVATWDIPALSRSFSEATSRTAAGEILELSSLRRVDLEDGIYENIVRGKTAWLLRCACEMGAIAGGASAGEITAAAVYGENLGMAFQLVDDALDFSPEDETGKPCGGDLREGKPTLPIMAYRESLPQDERHDFDRAFCHIGFSQAELESISASIRKSGFSNLARDAAKIYVDKARSALATLPLQEEREILDQLCVYVCERSK